MAKATTIYFIDKHKIGQTMFLTKRYCAKLVRDNDFLVAILQLHFGHFENNSTETSPCSKNSKQRNVCQQYINMNVRLMNDINIFEHKQCEQGGKGQNDLAID